VLDVPGRPRAIPTPGHAPGHCALLVEERGVLFAGDALCTLNPRSFRRGPQLMPPGFNMSDAQAEASLAAVAHGRRGGPRRARRALDRRRRGSGGARPRGSSLSERR
jgi:glyoxylase-like metal-dependent hydrolase (beta-lactamase superfamily II)